MLSWPTLGETSDGRAGYADRDTVKLRDPCDAAGARCLVSEADLLAGLDTPSSPVRWIEVALGIGQTPRVGKRGFTWGIGPRPRCFIRAR